MIKAVITKNGDSKGVLFTDQFTVKEVADTFRELLTGKAGRYINIETETSETLITKGSVEGAIIHIEKYNKQ